MKSYVFLQRFLLFFLALYAAIGFLTLLLPKEQEKTIIPFYSWFLFNFVPNETRLYDVRVYENKGQELSQPVLLVQVVDRGSYPKARELVQRFGISLEGGQENVEYVRQLFESSFLEAPALYEVGIITYNPLERWKDGNFVFKGLQKFEVR